MIEINNSEYLEDQLREAMTFNEVYTNMLDGLVSSYIIGTYPNLDLTDKEIEDITEDFLSGFDQVDESWKKVWAFLSINLTEEDIGAYISLSAKIKPLMSEVEEIIMLSNNQITLVGQGSLQ